MDQIYHTQPKISLDIDNNSYYDDSYSNVQFRTLLLDMKKTMSQIRPLTESAPLTEVTVVQLKLDAAEQEKLSQLGLHRGGTVRVLQSAINEPLLLAIGDARIGVNYQTAQKIFVY